MLKCISEDIEKTVHHALSVASVLGGHYKKTDEVRVKWDSLVTEMQKLRKSIPAEIRKNISN